MGGNRKELKRKKKKKENANVKANTERERERERERESRLYEAKCFYNSVRDLVVWHINKTSDFSIIPLLWYKLSLDVLE